MCLIVLCFIGFKLVKIKMKSSYKVRLNLFFLKYRKSLGIFNYSKNVVLLNYRSERSKGREFYCLNSYADLFNVFRANNSVMAGLEVEKILGGQKKMVQESCERGLIIKNTYLRMRVLGC